MTDLYDVARDVCHGFGIDWTDPRNGITYKAQRRGTIMKKRKSVMYRSSRTGLAVTLMSERVDETIGAQERYAYSHPDYIHHLEAMKIAIYEDERLQWLMKAEDREIGLYQTEVKARL